MAYEKERQELKSFYPSQKWTRKVNKMTDDVVLIILMRLKEQMKGLRKTA